MELSFNSLIKTRSLNSGQLQGTVVLSLHNEVLKEPQPLWVTALVLWRGTLLSCRMSLYATISHLLGFSGLADPFFCTPSCSLLFEAVLPHSLCSLAYSFWQRVNLFCLLSATDDLHDVFHLQIGSSSLWRVGLASAGSASRWLVGCVNVGKLLLCPAVLYSLRQGYCQYQPLGVWRGFNELAHGMWHLVRAPGTLVVFRVITSQALSLSFCHSLLILCPSLILAPVSGLKCLDREFWLWFCSVLPHLEGSCS